MFFKKHASLNYIFIMECVIHTICKHKVRPDSILHILLKPFPLAQITLIPQRIPVSAKRTPNYAISQQVSEKGKIVTLGGAPHAAHFSSCATSISSHSPPTSPPPRLFPISPLIPQSFTQSANLPTALLRNILPKNPSTPA